MGHANHLEGSLPPQDQKFLSAFIDRYRFSGLGELLKGIVHNLNGSLQVLSMQMELLYRMIPKEDKIQDQMEKCLGQIGKFKGMLGPLIQKGIRDEQDVPQPISLNEILEEELSLLHHNLFCKHQVRVLQDLSPSLPLLRGYYIHFSQGLSNLIQNALEAMENADSRELTVATRTRGSEVVVAVKDTGCGIQEEMKPHLFKPFFGNKGGSHSGVGLFISRELLRPYGASFQYFSQKGKTIFEVGFPIPSAVNR